VFGGLALAFHERRVLKIKVTVLNIAYAVFLFMEAWRCASAR
jgi:intracellular septation protein